MYKPIRKFCTNEYSANITCPKPKSFLNNAENTKVKNKAKTKNFNKKLKI